MDKVDNEVESAIFLKITECKEASEVTMACRGKSRGFTGQTPLWIKAWLTQEDDSIKNQAILIHRNDSNEIVGIVCVGTYGHESEKGAIAWLREVAVLPEYQNQGIGRKLIKQALYYCKKFGAKRAFLAVDECNNNAIYLYKSFGFKPSEEESQIDMVKISSNS